MAKKKSLLKKILKGSSKAEPTEQHPDVAAQEIAKPSTSESLPVRESVAPIKFEKTYPEKIAASQGTIDSFGAQELAKSAAIAEATNAEFVGELFSINYGTSENKANDEINSESNQTIATYLFHATQPGYRGWYWSVSVARIDSESEATICEVVLLPGSESLLAPNWIPYQLRVQPGDLRIGDVIPTAADDERLVPGLMVLPEDEDFDRLDLNELFEIGLGKARVLSITGKDAASNRWHNGDHGPFAAIAKAAPAQCHSCGFYVPLSGSLRAAFGVCANALSPQDGKVVAVNHGCGAHSQALITHS